MTDIADQISGWLAGRIPPDWFVEAPRIATDRDEVLVIGRLAAPKLANEQSEDGKHAACASRIDAFREETREARMRIASDAEALFRRKVSWGAECGEANKLFTHLGVPVMTRLRVQERLVLDTLVDAGVARTRSDALAWCVRLVASKEDEWLKELREAFTKVESVRSKGPTLT
ncbi:MAG: hypothetical protein HY678_11370 [Chloroflexi bacterium]|nr:hypothetical protein [Chloroflexota bacterium]